MAISAVNGASDAYRALSSGSRINSAKDDAAGLSIATKTKSQINTYDAEAENNSAYQSASNVKDGAYAGITDNLQRMRELAVKASNSLYGDEEKAAIQQEIDGLKAGIHDIVSNASYNGNQLLDGLENDLGIANFDVTSANFNIDDIDNALKTVSSGRSSNGAEMNGLEHAQSYNRLASYNATSALSRQSDTDYAETISKLKKEETLNTFQIMMQKRKQEAEAEKAGHLMMGM